MTGIVWRRLVVLSTLLAGLVASTAMAQVVNVSADQARSLLDQRGELFVLDVRTAGEYFEVRLAGARLIPIERLEQRVREIPRDRPVLVYCAVGKRSSAVASYLHRLGIREVYNLYGGIWAWQLRGYPVLKGPGG